MITRIQQIIESCITRSQIYVAMKYVELAKERGLINDSELYFLVELMMEKIETLNKI